MMEGMRYERGGKGKYWIPKPGEATSRTPLLSDRAGPSRSRSMSPSKPKHNNAQYMGYGNGSVEELQLDPDEESLYDKARALEFGDWNYPVITAHEASRERWLTASPDLLTTSANRNLLQPTKDNEIRRASNIRETVQDVTRKTKRKHSSKTKKADSISKGKQKDDGNGEEGRAPALKGMLRHHSSASSSAKSDRSQLVDLVVEDTVAEDTERVRARKEGSAAWNETEPKRFVRTYGKGTGEEIREGYEPTDDVGAIDGAADEFAVGDDEGDGGGEERPPPEDSEESRQWKQAIEPAVLLKPKYGIEGEAFENVWGGGEPSEPPKENP